MSGFPRNKKLLAILVLIQVLSVFLGLLHLALFDVSSLLKISSALILGIILLVFFRSPNGFRYLGIFFFFAVIISIYPSLTIGVLGSGSINRVVVDLLGIFLFFGVFLLVNDKKTEINLELFSLFILAISIFNALIMFFIMDRLGYAVNLTFGTPLIALASANFLVNKRYFYLICALALVLISGKRSILILTVLVLFHVYFLHRLSFFEGIKRLCILIPIVVIVVPLILLSWDEIKEVNPKLVKIEYLISFDASAYQASTGRVDEIKSVINEYENWSDWLFGKGVGSNYDVYIPEYELHKEKNNIHFSPLNLHYKFGFLFVILFYSFMIHHSFRFAWTKGDPLAVYVFYYAVFYSLTSYAFVVDLSFPVLLAILANHRAKESYPYKRVLV